MDVYINDMAMFMPNAPVSNDEIESVLGRVDNVPSRTKRIVLKTNGIKRRFYAIDRETGELTHSNARLAAEAVKALNPYLGFETAQIQCLCCGTTSPDLLFPGHALMVQGELELPSCDTITTAGICICGVTALKYAFMNVAMGMSENAVAVGSELSSSYMRSKFLGSHCTLEEDPDKRCALPFDADFLRWMLSDGAGAAFLSARPNPDRLSLKIDWIDHVSYAGEFDTCMYAGGVKNGDGSVVGWRQLDGIEADDLKHAIAVKQDVRLLDRYAVETMKRALAASIEKHRLEADQFDWYLPHYSSAYFRDRSYRGMQEIGFEIPYDRWFTNLETMGNTGSASIFIILAELLHSGNIKAGDKLLCFIPESGRFSHCHMQLTAVDAAQSQGVGT
ncbi:MAG: beta-ketoacyl-ACP synthase III [Desulfobacteraceae bacterium]|jgi:3-oxoacyl-[acyl-carrier-protein] synthase-3